MAKKQGKAPAYDKQKMFEFYVGTVANLRRDWDALANLFMDPKRRGYLNNTFPQLADTISTQMTISVYMGIAQLFDPPETFNDPKKPNLVLRRVIDDLAPAAGTAERKRIEADYSAMEPMVKLIKKWRNVVGAHRSLTTILALVDYMKSGKTQPHPLPHIPLMSLHAALDRLVSITDAIATHVHGKFQPWYDPAVVREVDTIFAAVGV